MLQPIDPACFSVEFFLIPLISAGKFSNSIFYNYNYLLKSWIANMADNSDIRYIWAKRSFYFTFVIENLFSMNLWFTKIILIFFFIFNYFRFFLLLAVIIIKFWEYSRPIIHLGSLFVAKWRSYNLYSWISNGYNYGCFRFIT